MSTWNLLSPPPAQPTGQSHTHTAPRCKTALRGAPCVWTDVCMFGCVCVCVCAQLKARDVAAQALGFVQSLVSALLNLHSYTEQRVHIYPLDSSIEAISPVNLKVQHSLHLLTQSSADGQRKNSDAPKFFFYQNTETRIKVSLS